MARRIIFIHTDMMFVDNLRLPLFVDAFVYVDWKFRVHIDSWTGDMASDGPSYSVFPNGSEGKDTLPYGHMRNPEDREWLKKAMTRPVGDMNHEALPIVARVNELDLRDDEFRKGFKIEVMTGTDAKNFIDAERHTARVEFAKQHWWQIGLGLLVAWWWFF